MQGPGKAVQTCFNVRDGKKVLIITDPMLFDFADNFRSAARVTGAEVVVNVTTPRRGRRSL